MRRRQIFALQAHKSRQSVPDPSGAAGSEPAAVSSPPPVSRAEEEATAVIWTPTEDPTAAVQVKRKRGRPRKVKP